MTFVSFSQSAASAEEAKQQTPTRDSTEATQQIEQASTHQPLKPERRASELSVTPSWQHLHTFSSCDTHQGGDTGERVEQIGQFAQEQRGGATDIKTSISMSRRYFTVDRGFLCK